MKKIEYILRIGIFFTFIGHGTYAYQVRPDWIIYLTTAGFNIDMARLLMHYIGMLDYLIAFAILLRPVRMVIMWAFIWALATAIIRPLAGLPVWEFFERGANWAAPLALMLIRGWPKKARDLLK